MNVLLQADHLVKVYPGRRGAGPRRGAPVRAVDDVSLTVGVAETLALVGESGSGKTTTARMIVQLERPTSGSITLDGRDIGALSGAALRQLRSRVQMVFQDPYDSLDPRLSVRETVATPLIARRGRSRAAVTAAVRSALELAGLAPAEAVLDQMPHQLSGGQRQRVAIARAIVTRPALIVADEPVSMLDVSLQAGILNTLLDLQNRLGTSYLLITHDLGVARYASQRIAVMYRGRVVESGATETVIGAPRHPYTRLLLAAAGAGRGTDAATGTSPPDDTLAGPDGSARRPATSADAATHGCAFAPRCPLRQPVCARTVPALTTTIDGTRLACHVTGEEPAAPLRKDLP